MIGDNGPGDRRRAEAHESPIVLGEIVDHLAALQAIRAGWLAELVALENQGIDEAIPSESWETRNGGETKYLRLVFPTDPKTRQRRKVYVGADPAAIEAARERVERRKRWGTLSADLRHLDKVLAWAGGEVANLERELRRWRNTWGQRDLPAVAQLAPTLPSSLWERGAG
jgi:hypothetical protein